MAEVYLADMTGDGAADEGYTSSSSQGETRILSDAAGTPLRSWRSGGLSLRPLHDAARRPIGLLVDEGAGERLVALTIFGDAVSDLPSTNHALGRPVHIYDTAGRVTLTYDLKGRVTAQTRTLLADITTEADWSGLESEGSLADIVPRLSANSPDRLAVTTADTFAVSTAYDALDRVTEQTAPDSSRTVPTYDEGGRLSQVEVYVRGDTTATELVSSITTNARGQREQIVYGNHTQTSYTYDPERLWLTSLTTTRSSGSSHGAATLQDLGFTRDAVGNITEITDDAQETVYFGNSQVSPTRTFTYDALYRLVSARGREKDAQTQSTAFYADYAGAMGTIPQSGSGVLRRYTQSYEYDAAGNILEVKHQQGDAGTVLWRRGYAYETNNNQLLSTSLPGDDPDDPGRVAPRELVASLERAERLWGVVRVSVGRTIAERSHIMQQSHELRRPPTVTAPDHLGNGRPGGGAPEARRGGEGCAWANRHVLTSDPMGSLPEGALGQATAPPALREATQASSSPPDREAFTGDGEKLVQ